MSEEAEEKLHNLNCTAVTNEEVQRERGRGEIDVLQLPFVANEDSQRSRAQKALERLGGRGGIYLYAGQCITDLSSGEMREFYECLMFFL